MKRWVVIWILILLFLSSVRGRCQGNDSTVVLPKRTAYFYYEQYKKAEYYKKKSGNLQIQLDSAFGVIREKNFQLTAQSSQLKGVEMLYTAQAIKLQVAHKDYDLLKVRFKRVRGERNIAIGTTSAILVYFVARSVLQSQ